MNVATDITTLASSLELPRFLKPFGLKTLIVKVMFVDIKDYMLKTKVERTNHIRLDEPCIEIGGNSVHFRGLLAYLLKTTLPAGNKVNLCHACNNGNCSNPAHLYWGTSKENQDDSGIRELGVIARQKRKRVINSTS